jgi:lauroyl/myristoyl acyltransferase
MAGWRACRGRCSARSGAGWALLRRLAGAARAAARNLGCAFRSWTKRARAKLLRAQFRAALGIGLFEFARAWWGSVAPMRRRAPWSRGSSTCRPRAPAAAA